MSEDAGWLASCRLHASSAASPQASSLLLLLFSEARTQDRSPPLFPLLQCNNVLCVLCVLCVSQFQPHLLTQHFPDTLSQKGKSAMESAETQQQLFWLPATLLAAEVSELVVFAPPFPFPCLCQSIIQQARWFLLLFSFLLFSFLLFSFSPFLLLFLNPFLFALCLVFFFFLVCRLPMCGTA